MRRRKPPSRVRYEAEHPSLTVRVPASVKARIRAAAEAEGLSVSEWVQAMAAGHAAEAASAYQRGRAEGYAAGEQAGYRKGRQAGEATGRWGGFVAGLLEARFLAAKGQAVDPEALARHLLQHPDQRTVAEAILRERRHDADLARLLRQVGHGRA